MITWIALILMIVGAINWGLIGLFKFNVIEKLFGRGKITRIIYSLVGISGIYTLVILIVRR